MSIFEDADQVTRAPVTRSDDALDLVTDEQSHVGAAGFTSTQPNVFHGENTFVDGRFAGYSSPTVLGGSAYHDVTGRITHSTTPNVLGGVNDHGADGHLLGYTTSNVAGGHDLHGTDGSMLASTSTNVFGGTHVVLHDHGTLDSMPNVFGGADWPHF